MFVPNENISQQAIMYLTRLKDRINFEVTDAQGKMDALNMGINAIKQITQIKDVFRRLEHEGYPASRLDEIWQIVEPHNENLI